MLGKGNIMRLKILGSGALAALALAACNQQPSADTSASSQPLAPPSPAETAPAPAASALPAAPAAPVRYAPPARRYQQLNDAYAMSQTYADAPPDYAFDYGGDAPEAWGSRDGVVRVGERTPGGWRYYYYQPGADTPYLVRDPEYAYGFEGGQLVVVYDVRGRALSQEYADRQAWLAGRYLARARDLWRAARDRQRMDVEAQVWREQQAEQERQRQYWEQTRAADQDWRAYHDQHEAEARDHWAGIAAAWAAVQIANQAERPRDGGVDAARQAWRERMAQQGPGPAPSGPEQPTPRQGWSQPNRPYGGQPGQPQPGGERPHDHGNGQPPQGQWSGRPGEPPPQGRPGGQGWAGGPSDHQAQAEADRQRQLQAQQQAEADRQHQLQQQGQAERQRQIQAQQQVQQQAQAERQRQVQAQQQVQAGRQRQVQAQEQAQAERQHQLQAQQQAQAEHQHAAQPQPPAAHEGKPQDHPQGHPPGLGAMPEHPGHHGASSQPPR